MSKANEDARRSLQHAQQRVAERHKQAQKVPPPGPLPELDPGTYKIFEIDSSHFEKGQFPSPYVMYHTYEGPEVWQTFSDDPESWDPGDAMSAKLNWSEGWYIPTSKLNLVSEGQM